MSRRHFKYQHSAETYADFWTWYSATCYTGELMQHILVQGGQNKYVKFVDRSLKYSSWQWQHLYKEGCFPQVRQLQESAAQLRTVYAGEKAEAIAIQEHEVMQTWKELLISCEDCRMQITTATDKLRFFGMVRDQLIWMDSIICQIGAGEKPRWDTCWDTCSLLIGAH